MSPAVTVLMPVLNGRRFVGAAVDSIRAQTLADFELVVVDDGSADGTLDVVGAFGDPRIVLVRNESTRGLACALNRGLDRARGAYVARMDADDVAEPRRLERQIAFLEANPGVGILGSACRLIDEAGSVLGIVRMPSSDLDIRWRLLTGNPFLHGSVMVRRGVLEAHGLRYDESFAAAQDYELWPRLLERARGANLEEPLLWRRVHGGSLSAGRAAEQSDAHVRIALGAISELWPEHPLDCRSFALLRRLLTEMRPLAGGGDRERCRLLNAYAGLLERFGARHGANREWPRLRRREAVATTFLALYPPWRLELGDLVRRLAAFEPALPAAFLAWAAGALGRRLLRARPSRKKDCAP